MLSKPTALAQNHLLGYIDDTLHWGMSTEDQNSLRASFVEDEPALIWLWKDDDKLGVYSPYETSVSKLLTERYRSTDCCDSCDFIINSQQYRVYFQARNQVNLVTRRQRSVLVEQWSADVKWCYLSDLSQYSAYTPLDSAAIEACYQHGQSSVRLVINGNRYVVNTRLQYQVNLKTGYKRDVKRDVKREVVPAYHNEDRYNHSKRTFDFPAVYSDTHNSSLSSPFQNTKPTLVPVERHSSKWRHVSKKIKATLPNATIVSIDQVQNQLQWDRYGDCMKRLWKHHGEINEKELFHGTRKTDPKEIYFRDQGFSTQFSEERFWGLANYFAVDACYSHGFAFQVKNTKYKKFFLVKVLTGYSCEMKQDSSLKQPPNLPPHLLRHSNGQSQYDTVTGITGGSRVYMTYDNYHAYPAYLIKYYI